MLLGLVLEAVTGRSYYDVVADEVFAPAGMTATDFPALDGVEPGLAIGYLRPEAEGETWRTNIYATTARGQPDGGAVTTAADLVTFLDAFLAGRLVGETWRDEMLRPRAWSADDEVHYGLTFQIHGEGTRARIGHSGGDPGVGADLSWFPEPRDPHGAAHERAAGHLRGRPRAGGAAAPRPAVGPTPQAGAATTAAGSTGTAPSRPRSAKIWSRSSWQNRTTTRGCAAAIPATSAPSPASSASSASASDG